MSKYQLNSIFDLQMGKTPARANSAYWNDGSHNWVSISDLSTYAKYVGATKETITERGVAESGIRLVPPNTVIMSFKLSIGKTAITTAPTYTNEAIMAFIDKGVAEICPDYIHYLFKGMDWTHGANKAVKGTTLNKATLGVYEIEIPTIDVQHNIAAALDKAQSLIAARREQVAVLDKLAKDLFVEMFGDPVRNEKGWDVKVLSDVATIKIGPFGTLLHREDYVVGGVPLINPQHMVDGIAAPDKNFSIPESKYRELSSYTLQENDIVLGRRGEIGRCAIVKSEHLPAICGTGSMIVRLDSEQADVTYVHSLFYQPSFTRDLEGKSTGSTMQNINAGIVKALRIPLPPIETQQQYTSRVAAINTQKSRLTASLTELETLYKSLTQRAFAGELFA